MTSRVVCGLQQRADGDELTDTDARFEQRVIQ